MAADLTALRARVLAATGADRGLDDAVFLATSRLDLSPVIFDEIKHHVPAYTASIDAAAALVERMLPGWRRRSESTGWALLLHRSERHEAEVSEDAATEPLAIVAALLSALIDREGE